MAAFGHFAWGVSLPTVRLPVFIALSWAVAALVTAAAIFASLYIGRAALQATHLTVLCTHDFYASKWECGRHTQGISLF